MKRSIVAIVLVLSGCAGIDDKLSLKPADDPRHCNNPDSCKIEITVALSGGRCKPMVAVADKAVIVDIDGAALRAANKRVDLFWVIKGITPGVQFTFSKREGILISGNLGKYFMHVGPSDVDRIESHWKATTNRSLYLPYDAAIKATTSTGSVIDCDPLDPIIAND